MDYRMPVWILEESGTEFEYFIKLYLSEFSALLDNYCLIQKGNYKFRPKSYKK